MPDNWDEPSHRLIADWSTIRAGGRELRRRSSVIPVADPAEYRAWLRPTAADIDQWRTTYYHVLEGPTRCWDGSRARS